LVRWPTSGWIGRDVDDLFAHASRHGVAERLVAYKLAGTSVGNSVSTNDEGAVVDECAIASCSGSDGDTGASADTVPLAFEADKFATEGAVAIRSVGRGGGHALREALGHGALDF